MGILSLMVKLVAVFILILSIITNSLGNEENKSKQILILASYNPGLRWTDSIGSEIENQLSIYYPTAAFSFEYMDTKKQAPTETRLAELKESFRIKYKDHHFDVIICSDDDAFSFLLKNRDELFRESPVVFCGVNFFEDKMLAGKKGFTGVVEAFDLPGTLSLMTNLHPKTKQIVVVNDRTTTGKANREVLNQTLDRMRQQCRDSGRGDLWELFDCRIRGPILDGSQVPPYEELVEEFALESPLQAANLLVTAKRMFARVLREVVGAYAVDDSEVDAEIRDLIAILSGGA